MKLFYFSIVLLVAIAVESVEAIECYQCNGQKGPGVPEEQPNCFDQFNAEGIATTQCDGRCFANSTTSVTGGFTYEMVQRGCMKNQCPPTVCTDVNPPPGQDGGGTGRFCNYCCDGELCNNMDLEQTAAAAGTFKCWFCQANVTDATPGSCASDDFNGEGAIALPCSNERCVTMMVGNGVSRACDVMDVCAQGEGPPGVQLECCDHNMCNVGSNNANGETSSEKPDDNDDDDDEGTIKCWRCDSEVSSNYTAEKATCFTGMFPAKNVIKEPCPSGKCISYTYVGGERSQMFSRGCVTPDMDNLGYCDGNNADIKDSECCQSNLCNSENSASANAISIVTILSALLVFYALALMQSNY